MTECCLFVCCRPSTHSRLVHDIYPKKIHHHAPATAASKDDKSKATSTTASTGDSVGDAEVLHAVKLDKLTEYAVAYPKKLSLICDDIMSNLKHDMKHKHVGRIMVSCEALSALCKACKDRDSSEIVEVYIINTVKVLLQSKNPKILDIASTLFFEYTSAKDNCDISNVIPSIISANYTFQLNLDLDSSIPLTFMKMLLRVLEVLSPRAGQLEKYLDDIIPILYFYHVKVNDNEAFDESNDKTCKSLAKSCFFVLSLSSSPSTLVRVIANLFKLFDKDAWDPLEAILEVLFILVRTSSKVNNYQIPISHALISHARNSIAVSSENGISPSAASFTPVLTQVGFQTTTGSEKAMRNVTTRSKLLRTILQCATAILEHQNPKEFDSCSHLVPYFEIEMEYIFDIMFYLAMMDNASEGLTASMRELKYLKSSDLCWIRQQFEEINLSPHSDTPLELVLESMKRYLFEFVKIVQVDATVLIKAIRIFLGLMLKVETVYKNCPQVIRSLRSFILFLLNSVVSSCKENLHRIQNRIEGHSLTLNDPNVSNEKNDLKDIFVFTSLFRSTSYPIHFLSATFITQLLDYECEYTTLIKLPLFAHSDLFYSRKTHLLTDSLFNILCSYGTNHVHRVVAAWTILVNILSKSGLSDIPSLVSLILALEEFWRNYPLPSQQTPSAYNSSLELIECQVLFFIAALKYIENSCDCHLEAIYKGLLDEIMPVSKYLNQFREHGILLKDGSLHGLTLIYYQQNRGSDVSNSQVASEVNLNLKPIDRNELKKVLLHCKSLYPESSRITNAFTDELYGTFDFSLSTVDEMYSSDSQTNESNNVVQEEGAQKFSYELSSADVCVNHIGFRSTSNWQKCCQETIEVENGGKQDAASIDDILTSIDSSLVELSRNSLKQTK